MDKIKVSIIGSCNSRELFNYDFMKARFEVNYYAFQTCVFDIIGESIDLPEEIINDLEAQDFYKRMLRQNANFLIPNLLEEAASEVIIVDLYSIIKDVLHVNYKGKQCFISSNVLPKVCTLFDKYKIEYEKINYKDVEDSIINNGLIKLASLINKCCSQNNAKVFLLYPFLSYNYKNHDNQIIERDSQTVSNIKNKQSFLNIYSDLLFSRLNKCTRIYLQPKTPYAVHSIYDGEKDLPSISHHPKYDEMLFAVDLYKQITGVIDFDIFDEYKKLFDSVMNQLFVEKNKK